MDLFWNYSISRKYHEYLLLTLETVGEEILNVIVLRDQGCVRCVCRCVCVNLNMINRKEKPKTSY